MMKNKKLIVVLGMHRSGTSSITRGLKVLGVELGDRLMPPVTGINEKGFWEDIDLTDLNVEILDALGGDWKSHAQINSADVAFLREKGFFTRAVEIIQSKTQSAEIYGFKDPRVAKLLPFWNEVFAHCNFDVRYVLVIRNPLSVAKSLLKRDGLDTGQSYLLWLDHVITSLQNNNDRNSVVIDYDLLMHSPEHELNRLSRQLELEINHQELQRYTTEFLDSELRHSAYQISDLLKDSSCPKIVSEMYIALLDLATDKIDLTDAQFNQQLKIWFTEFERIDPLLHLLDKVTIKQKKSDEYLLELTRAKEKNETKLSQLAHDKNEQIKQFEIHIANLNYSIQQIFASNSWKITKPIRGAVTVAKKIKSLISILPHLFALGGGVIPTLKKTFSVFRNEGVAGLRARVRFVFANQTNNPDYATKLFATKLIPYYVDPDLDKNEPIHAFNSSIVIHLHLNAVDAHDECMSYLKNIPFEFDLFVSFAFPADPEKITSHLIASLPCAKRIIVEPVSSSFGQLSALIIQFGSRIKRYELVAQVCTPSNLKNTAELNEWRGAISKLMGPISSTGGRIVHLLSLLKNDIDLIYSESSQARIRNKSSDNSINVLIEDFLKKYTKFTTQENLNFEYSFDGAFWLKSKCLTEFLGLSDQLNTFIQNALIDKDDSETLIQRLAFIFLSRKEYRCLRIIDNDNVSEFTEYEEQHDYSSAASHTDIKVLSYYLPQFHPTPENDLWHGKGFTEWTKVRATNPLFEGHYQQHFPHPDIGYYHLDSPDVLIQQADMMKKAGVYGQIFYHYWFSGKLILEYPAQLLLAHPEIDMPYCFCWANENWTRRWDGNDREILLGQTYSARDAIDFIRYLIPFFKDPRYIKVEGRPMLQVYRPSSMPNSQEYVEIWNLECLKEGIQPPYMVAVLTRGATDPLDFGMDAGVERVLHDWTGGVAPELNETLKSKSYWPMNGSALSYDDVADFYMSQTEEKHFSYFRSIVPIWDNTARYGSDAYVIHGSTPERFQKWMESSIGYTNATLPKDRRFLIVNAWNEWAEGAHLEPDTRYGYSYLNSIGRALSGISYADENRTAQEGNVKKVHIKILPAVLESVQQNSVFKKRFLRVLKNSEVLSQLTVTINTKELMGDFPQFKYAEDTDADFIIEIRRPAYFDSFAIENMLKKAVLTGAVVIPNSYGHDFSVIEITSNGSVSSQYALSAPMAVIPQKLVGANYKNVRLSLEARCYFTSAGSTISPPVVTSIIRFHKSGNFSELRNALFCLYAMNNCVVKPIIAAQDLNSDQILELNKIINSFIWTEGFEPEVTYYNSENGGRDLRSKMLNDSLKKVNSRYATFLDFDDLLMPFAYDWLINRLTTTGKAVAFGRVYWTDLISNIGQIIGRKRAYEYGGSYNDFVNHNHAPLHSFMLDMSAIDLSRVIFFDDQTYMEDYFLTLQLFSEENCDWESLNKNFYIGDYIHCVDRPNTLAITDDDTRKALFSNPHYGICAQRIEEMKEKIKRT